METTLFQQCVFEFLGTMVLVLMGDGVCAATTLNKSKAKGGGWVVVSFAWGFAVMCGVFIAGPYSGAHLNPAVSVGLAMVGTFPWASVVPYVCAQLTGGFLGAVLVWASTISMPRRTILMVCWAVSAPCQRSTSVATISSAKSSPPSCSCSLSSLWELMETWVTQAIHPLGWVALAPSPSPVSS